MVTMYSVLDQLQASAVEKFISSPQAAELVLSGDLGSDVSTGQSLLWVFQGSDDDKPFRDPEGTGTSAVVLTYNSNWGTNPHNTARFPVLTALVYADCSRTPSGEISRRDAKSRALRVSDALINVFHDAANRDHVWPLGLRVVSSNWSYGPDAMPIPGESGLWRASLRFDISLG